ncbi:cyclin-T1.1 [Ditylenchus destructor]|nr:cyclin-T1.1 [Ditylenchus destructor]
MYPQGLPRKKSSIVDEEVSNTPSRQDRISAEREMEMRQNGTRFIVRMVNYLGKYVRESRRKTVNNWIGVSAVLMHQFFLVHSMKNFNVKDISAVCVFLAGKTEYCPKLLEHVVNAWINLKFDRKTLAAINPVIMSHGLLDIKSREYESVARYFLTLENLILRTVGFNLDIQLPHPKIINDMRDRQKADLCVIMRAYEFANEILLRTDWCLRYTTDKLAEVCIFLAYNTGNSRHQRAIAKVLDCLRGKNNSYCPTIPSTVLNCQFESVEREDGEVSDND